MHTSLALLYLSKIFSPAFILHAIESFDKTAQKRNLDELIKINGISEINETVFVPIFWNHIRFVNCIISILLVVHFI